MSADVARPIILRIYFARRPVPGGMEGHVTELSRLQRDTGWRVLHVFAAGEGSDADDIRVRGLTWALRARPQALRDLLFFLSAMVLLATRRVRADVVHVHGDWSAILLGRLLAWVVGAPVLMAAIHGRIDRQGIPRSALQFALRRCDASYATGVSEARLLRELGARRAEWITSGFDPRRFSGGPGAIRPVDVIGVGSLVPVKNFALFLDVAACLPECSFVLVGGGPMHDSLAARIGQAPLANVSLSGALPPSEVARRMQAAKVLLLTSTAEGTPTVVLEGMACGLVIVSTPANELEVLLASAEAGEVVSAATARRLAAVLRQRLADVEGLARGSVQNIDTATHYTWAAVCARVNSLTLAAIAGEAV